MEVLDMFDNDDENLSGEGGTPEQQEEMPKASRSKVRRLGSNPMARAIGELGFVVWLSATQSRTYAQFSDELARGLLRWRATYFKDGGS
jgi:hypothetical protein